MWLKARDTLNRIADLAEEEDVTFTLENLNLPVDHPGVPFARAEDTLALVSASTGRGLRLNLDLYHAQIGEGNLIELCRACLPWIGEIQVADVPGRMEPGTGEINYRGIARALKDMGYRGPVGMEAFASGDPEAALAGLPRRFHRLRNNNGHQNSRPTVADIRAMKGRGQKISMLYVTTLEEAAAADAAGIDMLSIEGRFFSPEMREAAGRCFVQVGLPYGPFGNLVTAEDYLRAAYQFMRIGGDCFYCAASLDIQKALCDNAVPVVAHVGLIPSQCTWTGGFKAVGKTAESARAVWDHVKRLEAIGCFGAELEVVPDRVAELITKNTPMIMLGMGAGPHADAQYLFSEDVLGHTAGPQAAPRQDLPQLRRRI